MSTSLLSLWGLISNWGIPSFLREYLEVFSASPAFFMRGNIQKKGGWISLSMAKASLRDSLANQISPVRIIWIPVCAPTGGRLFPYMGSWPMLAGKAHTGPHRGGQRGTCLLGQHLGNVPGLASARRRHRGQGISPASAKMYIFAMLAPSPPPGRREPRPRQRRGFFQVVVDWNGRAEPALSSEKIPL